MKFFIKIVSSFDLINIHIVPDSQVKIALNLKKVLVGLVKIDDIATEININKFMLKVRMEDKSKKRLELYNFVKFFNLIVKDRIS